MLQFVNVQFINYLYIVVKVCGTSYYTKTVIIALKQLK